MFACDDVVGLCNVLSEAGRRARALCPWTCGCEDPFDPVRQTALTDPRDGCSVDTAPNHMYSLKLMPCKDVSPKGDDYDAYRGRKGARWTAFRSFLDNWAQANENAPLETQKETETDIKYLRKYGCDYLVPTESVPLGLVEIVGGVAGRRSKQPFYR